MKDSITKKLVRFSIPLILTGLLQQLFIWADTLILGRMNGQTALAAVGATSSINNLFVMSMIGFTSGLSILSARYYGAGEEERQKYILGAFTLSLGLIMVVLVLAGEFYLKDILRLMHTPGDIIDMSEVYLRYILAGIPFLTVYNIYGAVLRGHGNSKAPFICMALAGILNVILDLIFVLAFAWGVRGAALATLLSQVCSCISLVIYTIASYSHLRFMPGPSILSGDVIRSGLGLALPITARSTVSAMGSVVLQNFMNGFGTVTVAAITTAYRVDCVLLLPVINFATGISTMVSQYVGSREPENGRKTLYTGTRLMFMISVIMSAFIFFLGSFMVRIFGVGPEAVEIGGRFFKRLGLFYAVFGVENALSSYLEGNGKVVFTGFASISSLALRIVLSYALVGICGNMVIAWAEVISWAYLLVILYLRYLRYIGSEESSCQ